MAAAALLGVEAAKTGCQCFEEIECQCFEEIECCCIQDCQWRFWSVLASFAVKVVEIVCDWYLWASYFSGLNRGPLDTPLPALVWTWLTFIVIATVSGVGLCVRYIREMYEERSGGGYSNDDGNRSSIATEAINGLVENCILAVFAIYIYASGRFCAPSDGEIARLDYAALILKLVATLVFTTVVLLRERCRTKSEPRTACMKLHMGQYIISFGLSIVALIYFGIEGQHIYQYGTTDLGVWYTTQSTSISHGTNIPDHYLLATLSQIKDAGQTGYHRNVSTELLYPDDYCVNHYLFTYNSSPPRVSYTYFSVSCHRVDCICSKPFGDSHLFIGFRNVGDNNGADNVYEMGCPGGISRPLYDYDLNLKCPNTTSSLTAAEMEKALEVANSQQARMNAIEEWCPSIL